MHEIFWENLKTLEDPNEAYNKFLEILTPLYDKFFPKLKATLKSKKTYSPWITRGIAKSSKRIQKFYEKFLKSRSHLNETNYKNYKNLFETIKHKSKKAYYSEKLLKFQGDAKKTWGGHERVDWKNLTKPPKFYHAKLL